MTGDLATCHSAHSFAAASVTHTRRDDVDMESAFDYREAGWWFQIFIIFTPTWGDDPI